MTTTRLLWTGGWDSTFRLLCLLLVHRRSVTPYYLLRGKRPSTPIEVDTMARIRDALADHHPHTRELLQPTFFCDVADLSPDATITDAYERMLRNTFLGRQYEWLARFCTQQGIAEIELCIHRDDKAHAVLEPFVVEREEAGGRTWRLDAARVSQAENAADLQVFFRHFAFPLFETTKLQMASQAQAQGWESLMAMTWFCHNPLRNGQPCGCCHPCLYTIEEGLGHRLPRWSRTRSAIYRNWLLPIKSPVVSMLEIVPPVRRALERRRAR